VEKLHCQLRNCGQPVDNFVENSVEVNVDWHLRISKKKFVIYCHAPKQKIKSFFYKKLLIFSEIPFSAPLGFSWNFQKFGFSVDIFFRLL